MHLPAEEVVGRPVERLADDVPKRHLDAAQDAHQRDVGALGIAAPVDVSPQGLDLERISADDVMGENILDHRDDGFRPEARRVDLANPLDPAVCDELQEDEVAAAMKGRRVADDEGLDVGDLHDGSPAQRGDKMTGMPEPRNASSPAPTSAPMSRNNMRRGGLPCDGASAHVQLKEEEMRTAFASGLAIMMMTTMAYAQKAPSPDAFVNTAAVSNMFEIETSKAALERATSPDVKTFAQQMID